MRRRFLFGFAGLALAACASAPAGPQQFPGKQFSGRWAFHFETSSFVADSGEGPYWLAGEGDVWPQLTAPFTQAGSPWGEAHIVVEGELSAPGRYGHLGAYAHELRVTRVIASALVSVRR